MPHTDLENTRVRPRFQSQQHSSRAVRLLFVFVVCGIVLLALLVGVLRLPDLQITEVRVEGARSLDPLVIQNATWALLEGSYVSFIPKTNVLFLSKDRMQEGLKRALPSLSQVEFGFENRKIIIVRVRERTPLYVWCSERAPSQCYFVDNGGVLFEEAPSFTPGVFVMLSGGKEIPGAILGSEPLSAEELLLVEKMIALLQEQKFGPIQVRFLQDGDVTVSCEYYPGMSKVGTFEIRFIKKMSPELLKTTLSLLARDKNFTSTLDAHPMDIQYIDLRFPNKIIYKFRQGSDEAVAPQVP